MYHPDTDWPINAAAAAAELTWTRYEDKLFEEALLMYPNDVIDRWQKIVDAVPGKTADQIDSGHVELPSYAGHVEQTLNGLTDGYLICNCFFRQAVSDRTAAMCGKERSKSIMPIACGVLWGILRVYGAHYG
ncbi:hypothetical protein SSX86_006790 [Deinandra increscens subsp. villosa]|uniref:Myb-like domain-containing protein n=1 Tax=Deinandra increscens subsp. villosa TaxID=3103831 RepID=A0AAP0DJK5_9ASTR